MLINWSKLCLQYIDDNLSLMSVGFLLGSPDDAIIWRGPKKNAMIREFLSEVDWGQLEYLLIDTPPGTSDEHLSTYSYLKNVCLMKKIIFIGIRSRKIFFKRFWGLLLYFSGKFVWCYYCNDASRSGLTWCKKRNWFL